MDQSAYAAWILDRVAGGDESVLSDLVDEDPSPVNSLIEEVVEADQRQSPQHQMTQEEWSTAFGDLINDGMELLETFERVAPTLLQPTTSPEAAVILTGQSPTMSPQEARPSPQASPTPRRQSLPLQISSVPRGSSTPIMPENEGEEHQESTGSSRPPAERTLDELAQNIAEHLQRRIAREVPDRRQQEPVYRAISILSRDQLQELRERGAGDGGGGGGRGAVPRNDHQVITRTKTTTTVKRGQRPVSHRTSESIASPLNRGQRPHRRLSIPSSEDDDDDDDENTVRTQSDFSLTRHDRRQNRNQRRQQRGQGDFLQFLTNL